MKIIYLLLSSFLFIGSAYTQEISNELRLPLQSSPEDRAYFENFTVDANGFTLYTTLQRQGKVVREGKKKFGLVSGMGASEAFYPALIVHQLDANLQPVETKVENYKIYQEDEGKANYTLIKKKGKITRKEDILGKSETDKKPEQIAELYPDAFAHQQEENTVAIVMEKAYGKIGTLLTSEIHKGFDINMNVPFEEIMPLEPISLKLDLPEGKNQWLAKVAPKLDLTRNQVVGLWGLHIKKDKTRRNNFQKEMTIAAFNSMGKVLGKHDLKYEKVHRLLGQKALFDTYSGAKDQQTQSYALLVGEAFGAGYKKINPTPNTKARDLYILSTDGRNLDKYSFEASGKSTTMSYVFKQGGQVQLLMEVLDKKYYRFSNIALSKDGQEITKEYSIEQLETLKVGNNGKKFYQSSNRAALVGHYDLPNQEYLVYGQVATGKNHTDYLFFHFSAENELLKWYQVERPENSGMTMSSQFNFHPLADDELLIVLGEGLRPLTPEDAYSTLFNFQAVRKEKKGALSRLSSEELPYFDRNELGMLTAPVFFTLNLKEGDITTAPSELEDMVNLNNEVFYHFALTKKELTFFGSDKAWSGRAPLEMVVRKVKL